MPPQAKSSPETSPPSKMSELDAPLGLFGFEINVVSAAEVTGRLHVTDRCCQPFKVLHGGVSALISEGMASMGAHVASGFRRIAGIQLSINRHRAAAAGDYVFARATPVHAGETIQVWEVMLWRMKKKSSMEKEALISSARVTILSNLPVPSNATNADVALRKIWTRQLRIASLQRILRVRGVYNMKNTINERDKLADKIESKEKEKIEAALKEALERLDNNQNAEKEDFGGADGDGDEDDDSNNEL